VNEPDFAAVASLAGEPARATMLTLLFDGRALPAGELARAAGISAATASVHLSKLVQGNLLRVHSQGRHRYYELARPEIAHVLESLGSIARPAPIRSLRESLRAQRLRFARSCYDHLAGETAIALAAALVRARALEVEEDGFRLGPCAHRVLLRVGVDITALFGNPREHVRTCIDWTERRRHISGPLGSALLESFLQTGTFRRRSEPRVLELTGAGRAFLLDAFGLDLTESKAITA